LVAQTDQAELINRISYETTISRYKALIGPRLRARGLVNQQGEGALGVEVLNRMIRVAKPVSVRIA
jgi:hypothetical protein